MKNKKNSKDFYVAIFHFDPPLYRRGGAVEVSHRTILIPKDDLEKLFRMYNMRVYAGNKERKIQELAHLIFRRTKIYLALQRKFSKNEYSYEMVFFDEATLSEYYFYKHHAKNFCRICQEKEKE
jgi:hypothetical protein